MEPSRCRSSAESEPSESPDKSQHEDTASASGLERERAAPSAVYIRYKYHPNARRRDTTESLAPVSVAPREAQDTQPLSRERFLPGVSAQAPWSPFCTRADFEVAENVIQASIKGKQRENYLRGVGSFEPATSISDPAYVRPYTWHSQSNVTFSLMKDFDSTLDLATNYVLKVGKSRHECYVAAADILR
jgi:hypothetical protein